MTVIWVIAVMVVLALIALGIYYRNIDLNDWPMPAVTMLIVGCIFISSVLFFIHISPCATWWAVRKWNIVTMVREPPQEVLKKAREKRKRTRKPVVPLPPATQ